jgi:tetratricopeptide (TPR) repeat protein
MFYMAQQIDPDCALCYYNIGNCLFIQGQYKKAVGCWLRTAELEKTHPQINYRIAQAYWADGDLEKAREHFLCELRNNPGDTEAIFDFGQLLIQTGEIEAAKEKFNRILELDPDFAPALFCLGEIAFNNRQYEEAKELFDKALQKDSKLKGPRYRLAYCALKKGNWRQAKAYLDWELELIPEDSDVLVGMGSMFMQADYCDEALRCFLMATDLDFANAQAYYYLGLATLALDRLEDAAEFFGHALDIDPDHTRAMVSLANIYYDMGKIYQAAEMLDVAREALGDDDQLKLLAKKIRMRRIKDRIIDLAQPIKRLLHSFK